MIRPSALLLALLMASPALYHAFVTEQLPVQSALLRFLIAVAVAAVMVGVLRFITAGYGARQPTQLMPLRRRTDPPADDPAAIDG